MDSVLTSMVEDDYDSNYELVKSLKQITDYNYLSLFRSGEFALAEILRSQESSKKEVIIPALAPMWVYDTIYGCGYESVIVDVDPISGLIDYNEASKKVNDSTLFLLNICHYLQDESDGIYNLGIPVIDILSNGFMDNPRGDYAILSMEEDTLLSSKGGSVLLYNKDDLKSHIKNSIEKNSEVVMPDLNAAFAIPQVADFKDLLEKKEKIISLYKDALLKSGYTVLDSSDYLRYRSLPLVVKRGLKDIKKLFKDSGVETALAFSGAVIKELTGLKCKNARSLSNRTLIIPSYINLTKDSVELILKLLSTLP